MVLHTHQLNPYCPASGSLACAGYGSLEIPSILNGQPPCAPHMEAFCGGGWVSQHAGLQGCCVAPAPSCSYPLGHFCLGSLSLCPQPHYSHHPDTRPLHVHFYLKTQKHRHHSLSSLSILPKSHADICV